jgi:hypothetical protein
MAQKWILDQPIASQVNPKTGVPNSLYADPASQLLAMFDPSSRGAYTPAPLPAQVKQPSAVEPQQEALDEPQAPMQQAADPSAAIMRQIMSLQNDPEQKANRDKMRALLNQSFEEQQKGINENEEILKNYQNQGRSVDLSPLLALTDSWTGSNLSKGYTRPLSSDDYAKQLIAMKNLVQNQKRDLVDKQIEALSGLGSSNKSLGPLLELARMGKQDDRFDRKFDLQREDAIDKKYDGLTKTLPEKSLQFRTISEQLSNPNTVNLNIVAGLIARAVAGEKGVLTDSDIGRVIPNRDIYSKFKELESKATGSPIPLTSENINELRKLAKDAETYTKQYYELSLKNARNSFKKRGSYSGMPAVDELYQNYADTVREAFSGPGARASAEQFNPNAPSEKVR